MAARSALAQRRTARLPAPSLPRLTLGDDGLRILITVLVVLGAPPFGVLLACFFAWQLHNEGRTGMRNVMLALALLALLPPLLGIWLWGFFLR